MVKNSIKVYARLKNEDVSSKKVVKYQIYRRVEHEDISFPVNSTTDVPQKNRKYRFCKIFDELCTQADIFTTLAVPIINSVVNGFNGTIFAYGQTGSGKTYSITGSPSEYNKRGILPRCIEQIFELTKTTPNLYNIYVSYLEIYNEVGYDLLNSKCQPSKLEELPRVILLEDANGEAHLRNLSVLPVASEQEAMRLVFLGDTNRTIAETPMNEYSSRSHCIFTIYVNSRNESGGKLRRSKLHLVDLAGSERICKAKISGVTLREAKNINLSLHYLEQVILALSQSNRTHIPYRNSMMTYILRDSLSGNSLTSMLATLAITQQNHPETVTTCKFAQRVACISTEAIINEEVDPQQEIEYLRSQVDELRRQLAEAKGGNPQKVLSYEEEERCKNIANGFLVNNKECLLENLSNPELVCCIKYLKSNLDERLNNYIEKQKIEDEKIDLTQKFSKIIKEKEEEISTLTKLLETDPQKSTDQNHLNENNNQKLNSYYDLPKLKEFDFAEFKPKEIKNLVDLNEIKNNLPISEPNLFDTFMMDKNNTEGINQIKESLEKKYDLAKSVSRTVQKCEDNIKDIRQKLAKEPMGTEMSEKLHTFLISQQKIYKESLDHLEDLKSETEFLKESLKQAEKKVVIKFENTVKNKSKEKSEYGYDFYDFMPEKDEYEHNTKTKSKDFDVDTFYNVVDDETENVPSIDEIYIPNKYSTCTDTEKDFSESNASLLNLDIDSFEKLPYSSRSLESSRTYRSKSSTPKSTEDKRIDTPRNASTSLIKTTDTPEFIEFMKTIPLTGDFEVDDEIFNFYRSKFEH
nr:kinesin-like protein KIF6 [Onthophagus taurus]